MYIYVYIYIHIYTYTHNIYIYIHVRVCVCVCVCVCVALMPLYCHPLFLLNPFQVYRGTALIRNTLPLGPYSRPMPRALWWS